MTPTFAVRLEFAIELVNDAVAARAIGEIMCRPCFALLDRACTRRRAGHKDRWNRYAKPTPTLVATYLADATAIAVALEPGRGRELIGSAAIDNGTHGRERVVQITRNQIDVCIPVTLDNDPLVAAFCDLAAAVDLQSGFVATDLTYGLAHKLAVGQQVVARRPGLSARHMLERGAYDRFDERKAFELSGSEWGTFLGPGHLARIDLAALRASGAFERVIEVSPRCALLLVTADPTDDLALDFETRLDPARAALAPILMDIPALKAAQ